MLTPKQRGARSVKFLRLAERDIGDVGWARLCVLAALLAFTGGREPETFGKPSRLLFEAIAREASSSIAEMVMVGDDAEVDVEQLGLLMAGIRDAA